MSNGAGLGLAPGSGDGVTAAAAPAVAAPLPDAGMTSDGLTGSDVEGFGGGKSEACETVVESNVAVVKSAGTIVVDRASVGVPVIGVEGDGVSAVKAVAMVEFMSNGDGLGVGMAAAPALLVACEAAASLATTVDVPSVAEAALPPFELTTKPTTPPKAPIPSRAVLVSVTMSSVEAALGAVVIIWGIAIVEFEATTVARTAAMVVVTDSVALEVALILPAAVATVGSDVASVTLAEPKTPPNSPMPSPERSFG